VSDGSGVGGSAVLALVARLALAEELQRKGIQVARRTVAKYREGLRIPTSSERQRAG
jgi:hypothetical protein